MIAGLVREAPAGRLQSISSHRGLAEAVRAASDAVSPGDVVLLSPGGTSFDEFVDFAERGECFKRWVSELP
jgi:UDP-N-acetylmuramoylalanine--D-glutamate ligase